MKKLALILSLILLLLPISISCTPPPPTNEELSKLLQNVEADKGFVEKVVTLKEDEFDYVINENGNDLYLVLYGNALKIAIANGLEPRLKAGTKLKITYYPTGLWYYYNCIVCIKSEDESVIYLDYETGKMCFKTDIEQNLGVV